MRAIIAVLMGIFSATALALAAEPIATTDGETPGLSLQVQELKVSNGTAMLRFTIVNDSSGVFDPSTLADKTAAKPDYSSISGVYLVDTAHKKKYLVVLDSDSHCLCSRESQNIQSKSGANLWAKFPAPPDDVQKIGVVVPHFVPLDDVPISR